MLLIFETLSIEDKNVYKLFINNIGMEFKLQFFVDDEEDLGTPEEYLDDWQFAIKKMTQRIIDQKRSITKLSKLCLGSLNAVEKLEVKLKGTNFKDNPEREIFGDRLGKLENDFGKISLMMKGTSDRVSRLTEFAASDKTQQRMDRLEDHNETLKESVITIEKTPTEILIDQFFVLIKIRGRS